MTTISPTFATPLTSLRLLGAASVQGVRGAIVGRGTRGKRMALLALLAAARGGTTSREKLLAILWPDADAERGRPLLSDALYIIRSALGDECIITTGDDVGLNSAKISSDVETFERLFAEKQFANAVAVYGGAFLDGFQTSGEPEFERWMEGERASLARKFGKALDELASESETTCDWSASVTWLRQLASHDPYSSEIAIRLMRALNSAGNRAGALQHARIHAALLQSEFEAEPDAAVLAFAEQLKRDQVSVAKIAAPSETAPSLLSKDATSNEPTLTISQSIESQANDSAITTSSGVAIEPAPFAAGRRRRYRVFSSYRTIAASLIAGIAIASGVLLWPAKTDASVSTADRMVAERSIAVLPFTDISAAKDHPYFSDGLTEEIIGLLGRVEALRVAASSSSFALRNAGFEARRMGDTLNVSAVLEGSVRREGTRVRVSAQLIDVASGFQLWSKSYDRQLSEMIELQREIASAIVSALELELGAAASHSIAANSQSAEAYDLYLRGTFSRNKLTREGLTLAVEYFDRAIRLDSTYAPAYAGKASAIGPMVWYGYLPREQGAPLMQAAARRAVDLDASSSEAHVASGMSAFYFDWDWGNAEREFRRAIALNANDSHAHHFLANLLKATGRFEEAIAARTRAMQLDPLSIRMGMQLGGDYLVAGKLDLAEMQFRRTMELEPKSPAVLGVGPSISMGLGHVFERQRNYNAAMAEYLRIDSLSGIDEDELRARRMAFETSGIKAYWQRRAERAERNLEKADPMKLAWMWARTGNAEKTIASLERAYRERNLGLAFVASLPEFGFVKSERSVTLMIASMGLTDALVRADRSRVKP